MGHKVGGVRRQNVSLSLPVTLIMGLHTCPATPSRPPCPRKGSAHARQPLVDTVTEGAVRRSTSSRKMDKEEADLGSATTCEVATARKKWQLWELTRKKTTMSQRCAACALPLQHPHPRGTNTHTRSSVRTIPQCGVLAIREVQGAGVLNLRGGRGVCVWPPT